jgi:dihydrofolate reductase
MPEVIIIVAIADNGVIGNQGTLPWHLPSDLRHFKETTFGFPIIMGRKTFEAIGKPLPGRDNIVLTRDPDRVIPGCLVVSSLPAALELCRAKEKAFIIGGGDIFRIALPVTDTIIVTALERPVAGDVTFPPIEPEQFVEVSRRHYEREEPYAIIRYERVAR